MGYDIDIKHNGDIIDSIYMTYNHCKLFQKYNIYPRDFNGKTISEIIPNYIAAKEILENAGTSGIVFTESSTAIKYSDNKLYQATDDVILYVINDTLDRLYSYPEDAKWYSD